MTTPTTIPTPRTDAHEHFVASSPPKYCDPEFCRQLETELTLAQASLATAQAACVVKDEALRELTRLTPASVMVSTSEHMFHVGKAALAADCAAPITAKLARMRTALETQHSWHLDQTERTPVFFGDTIGQVNADEYQDSQLCEITVEALKGAQ